MKRFLYLRLALSGIYKNRKLYLPYILSTVGTIAVYYIIHFLSCSPFVINMAYGNNVGIALALGKIVIAVFSLIFLFYTNSFLTRRRYKEFGLYNILGMTKRNIFGIVFWETLIVSVTGLAAGIFVGIIFSKLAELGLMKLISAETNYIIFVSGKALYYTVLIYGALFFILMLKSFFVISRTNPIALMQSENVGEKPIKANWVLAFSGALILGGAYYMSVSIDNPLTALTLFFVAVIMVIIGTYLLFMSGSVALCKILQKNKSYYYKKNHFISVSSMTYRMKRNGAGLASICILSTMVLVMISSTGSLYFGKNNALKARYPRDTEISVVYHSIDKISDDNIAKIKSAYDRVFENHRFTPKNVLEYRYGEIAGLLKQNTVQPNPDYDTVNVNYSDVRSIYFISLADYNRVLGTDYTLEPGEAMIYTLRCKYDANLLNIGDLKLRIVKTLDRCINIGEANSLIMPSFFIVIPDFKVLTPLASITFGDMPVLFLRYHYGYDSDAEADETIAVYKDQSSALEDMLTQSEGARDDTSEYNDYGIYRGCIAEEKDDFNSLFGGMFFLGIILSIIFIIAAAVIIYYKQVSEGYEDAKRFEILQNVGMTKTDIRKTINSQILTVFFAPLILSGLHLGFAFPFLWKILQMFSLTNLRFIISVTLVAFAIFGVFYTIIYKLTARLYYSIVTVKE